MRLFTACLVVGAALMILTDEIGAQQSIYDQHALRIDSGLNGLRITRGVSDSVVLTVGIVKPVDIAGLVAGSPKAVEQARVFESNYRQGIWTAALGFVIWPAIFAINHIGPDQPVSLPVTVTAIALVSYGAIRIDSAKRALSSAIWWFNRDLRK
jgi:hypothetical protein